MMLCKGADTITVTTQSMLTRYEPTYRYNKRVSMEEFIIRGCVCLDVIICL